MSAEPITPEALVELLLPRVTDALLAFDVDGVLAPLVAHADEAKLSEGVADALAILAGRHHVALLSGRSLGSLSRLLDFPDGLHVIGSHGLEIHGTDGVHLSDAEQEAYGMVTGLGHTATATAGPGAWLERKPASVVVHTRQASPDDAAAAVDALMTAAADVPGVVVKPGHHVVELMVRATDKGSALLALGERLRASPLVFVGDDQTDEDAFARMAADDVSVHVGPGETIARYRLADAAAAGTFVVSLAESARHVER